MSAAKGRPGISGFDVGSQVRREAKKDAPIQVFVTADFRQRVNAAAHDARVSMSEYVRRALEAYLPADEHTGRGAA